jgi:hypothetical protein
MGEMLAFQAVAIVCATAVFIASLRALQGYLEVRRRRSVSPPSDAVLERLDRIELAVDATAVEVERISEANRFMAKLLADRTATPSLPSRPERVITPH